MGLSLFTFTDNFLPNIFYFITAKNKSLLLHSDSVTVSVAPSSQ